MPEIRLIAMDMDGTLLCGHPGVIPPENLAALHAATDAGIHLALASGRMPADAGFFARDAGLPMAVIALNGGCAMTAPGQPLSWSLPFDPATAEHLYRLASASGLLCALFGASTLWVSDPDKAADRIWGTHLRRPGSGIEICTGKAGAERILRSGVHKLVALGQGDPERVRPLREALVQERLPVSIAGSWYDNIEVNPAGVDKGSGLRRLADALGLPMTQVMAIGDADNDAAMIRAAGVGVAMGNALPAVRAAARWQTRPNDQAGVAAAIRHLALNQPQKGVVRLG